MILWPSIQTEKQASEIPGPRIQGQTTKEAKRTLPFISLSHPDLLDPSFSPPRLLVVLPIDRRLQRRDWAPGERDAAAAAEPGRCADAACGRAAVRVPDATAAATPSPRRRRAAAAGMYLPTYLSTLHRAAPRESLLKNSPVFGRVEGRCSMCSIVDEPSSRISIRVLGVGVFLCFRLSY